MSINILRGYNNVTADFPISQSGETINVDVEAGKKYVFRYKGKNVYGAYRLPYERLNLSGKTNTYTSAQSYIYNAFTASTTETLHFTTEVVKTYVPSGEESAWNVGQGMSGNKYVANAARMVQPFASAVRVKRSIPYTIHNNTTDYNVCALRFTDSKGSKSNGGWIAPNETKTETLTYEGYLVLLISRVDGGNLAVSDIAPVVAGVTIECESTAAGIYDLMLFEGTIVRNAANTANEILLADELTRASLGEYNEYRRETDSIQRNVQQLSIGTIADFSEPQKYAIGEYPKGRTYTVTFDTTADDGHVWTGKKASKVSATITDQFGDVIAATGVGGGRTLTFTLPTSHDTYALEIEFDMSAIVSGLKVNNIQIVEGDVPYEYMQPYDIVAAPEGYMKMYRADGQCMLLIPITANAKYVRELMKSHQVELSWNDVDSYQLPVGAYVEYDDERFYLANKYLPEIKSVGSYTYQPKFVHEIFLLSKYPFLLHSVIEVNGVNVNSVESDWNYTGTLNDLANRLSTTISEAIGTSYTIDVDNALNKALQLSFSNVDILSALNMIAESFEQCEWYYDKVLDTETGQVVPTIHFVPMCLYNVGGSAITLTAGQEVSFPTSNNKGETFNRFYVFGSTRNIPQDYQGAETNTIVKKRLTLDPSRHPSGYIALPQFDDDGNIIESLPYSAQSEYRTLIEENGVNREICYVPDESVLSGRTFTKVLTLEDIYPRADLVVTDIYKLKKFVRDTNGQIVYASMDGGEKVPSVYYWYYIKLGRIDNGVIVPFTINPTTYSPESNPNGNILKGLTLSLHFKTGALTGREFEAAYWETAQTKSHEDGSGSLEIPANVFEVMKIEDNTIIIPNTNIEPRKREGQYEGDEVIVFNIKMPNDYVQAGYDNLEKEALRQIWELTKDGNTYNVKSNQVYFAQNSTSLVLGQHTYLYVNGSKIDTRVTKLSSCLDRTYEQEIGFSKAISKGTITSLITAIESTARNVVTLHEEDSTAVKLSKKQLYDAQREQMEAVFDPDGTFQQQILPVAIQTTMIQVGAKSTNFTLANVTIAPYEVANAATSSDGTRVQVIVGSTGGKLTHYGIGSEIREWTILSTPTSTAGTLLNDKAFEYPTLTDSGLYYIYARCQKSGNNGWIVFSQAKIKFNEDENAQTALYYFLVGTVSSRMYVNGKYRRTIATSYGTTQISGNNITTGKLQSLDGSTYIDLDRGEISGKITFTSSQEAEIKGWGEDAAAAAVGEIEGDVSEALSNSQSAMNTAQSASTTAQGAATTAAAASATASAAGTTANNALLAVNNLQIGGRNYLLKSDGSSSANIALLNAVLYTLDGVKCVKTTTGASLGFYITNAKKSTAIDTTNNVKWTASVDARTDYLNTTIRLGIENKKTKDFRLSAVDTWERITVSGETIIDTLICYSLNDVATVYFKNWKLEYGTVATDWTEAPEDVDERVQNATDAAEQALSDLEDYASDSKISPTEKQALKQQWTDIQNEYSQVCTEADKYSVSKTAYQTAYTNVQTAFTFFLASATWADHIDISSGANKTNYDYIAAYYEARTAIMNAIAVAAKGYVDNIQVGNRNYALGTATAKDVFRPSTGYNVYWYVLSELFKDSDVQQELEVTISYKVSSGWTYSFPPLNQCTIGSTTQTADIWSLRGVFDSYEVVNGGRRYSCKITIPVHARTNTANAGAGGCIGFFAESKNSTRYPSEGTVTISEVMLTIGNKVVDWQEAPEDIQGQITQQGREQILRELGGINLLTRIPDYFENVGSRDSDGGRDYSSSVAPRRLRMKADHLVKVYGGFTYMFHNYDYNTIAWFCYVWEGTNVNNLTYKGYIHSSSLATEEWTWNCPADSYLDITFRDRSDVANMPPSAIRNIKFKLEIGSVSTSWSENEEEKLWTLNYLKEGIEDAKSGTTSIEGGLVLSRFLAVKDGQGNVVAGLNGSDHNLTEGGALIFSGYKANDENCALGTFRVYRDGSVVSSSESNKNNYAVFNNGALQFYLDNKLKTVVTSDSMGGTGITSGMANLSTTIEGTPISINEIVETQESVTYDGGSVYTPKTATVPQKTFSQTWTLLNAQDYSGKVTIPSISALLHLDWSIGGNMYAQGQITGGDVSASIVLKKQTGNATAEILTVSNNGVNTQMSAWGTLNKGDNDTDSLNYQVNIPKVDKLQIPADTKITLTVELAITSVTLTTADYEDEGYTVRYHSYASLALSQLKASFVTEFYKDTVYSDGLLMASASDKYFGIDPLARDGRMLAFVIGSMMYKFTANGLLWKGGGSDFYRVNPLILVIKYTYENGNESRDLLYNPLNLSVSTQKQSGDGVVKVTHNLGHTNYSVSGIGARPSQNSTHVVLEEKAAAYFLIRNLIGGSSVNGSFELQVFDCSKFS